MSPRRTRPHPTAHLLIDDKWSIAFLPSLARLLGERRAIVLQQLWFLQSRMGTVVGGIRYVYLTYDEWRSEHFTWLNKSSIRAVLYDLQKRGVITPSPTLGARGETGWSVDRDMLLELFDEDSDAGCELDDEGLNDPEQGGVPNPNTPRFRKALGARACAPPPAEIQHPPPAQI